MTRTLSSLTVLLLAQLGSLLCVQAADESKPNILFILTDDQGYGDVGRHGHPLSGPEGPVYVKTL